MKEMHSIVHATITKNYSPSTDQLGIKLISKRLDKKV